MTLRKKCLVLISIFFVSSSSIEAGKMNEIGKWEKIEKYVKQGKLGKAINYCKIFSEERRNQCYEALKKAYFERQYSKEEIEKLQDQRALAWVAINDDNDTKCKTAFGKLHNDHYLMEVINGAKIEEMRIDAVKKIRSDNVLLELTSDEDIKIRRAAYEKFKKEGYIIKWIKVKTIIEEEGRCSHCGQIVTPTGLGTCPNCGVKFFNPYTTKMLKKAEIKTGDQKLIAEIAKNKHLSSIVRTAAIEKLEDQEVLAEMIKVGCRDGRSLMGESVLEMAIEKIVDQELLAWVAKNYVRDRKVIYAIWKLAPEQWQELLAEIVTNPSLSGGNTDLRHAAIEKLDSDKWQELFVNITKDKYEAAKIQEEALKKLDPENNQELFADMAKNGILSNWRKLAVEKLDPFKWHELLRDIAANDEDNEVRNEAARMIHIFNKTGKIYDPEKLVEVAKNDEDYQNRLVAVRCLKNQDILIDIAKNNEWNNIRDFTMTRLDQLGFDKLYPDKWQDLLVYIAKNDGDKYVRCHAIDCLKDPEVLAEIAKNDGDDYVRRRAMTRLDQLGFYELEPDKWQDLLVYIVKNDEDSFNKEKALKRLDPHKWQEFFADIANNNDEPDDIREAALYKLYNNRWQDVLADIAKNDESVPVRKEAIKKLDIHLWQNLLADIAKHDEDPSVREEAISKLDADNWQDVLADIAKNDEDESVRKEALYKLDMDKWQNLLVEIRKNDEDESVRELAMIMLNDEGFKKLIEEKDY